MLRIFRVFVQKNFIFKARTFRYFLNAIYSKSFRGYPNLIDTKSIEKNIFGTPNINDIKVDKFDEAKLLNFFSAAGINFQNIASNDAMIAARIMELESEGYTMAYVTSAVESVGGKDDDSGIFISRMYFRKSVSLK